MLTRRVARVTKRSVRAAKRLKLRAKRRFQLFTPVEILPFRGYGTPTHVRLSGRVLESDGVVHGAKDLAQHTRWDNFRATVRRFRSDEIPHARILARLGRTAVEVETDEEGYFDVHFDLDEPLESGWHDVEVELVSCFAGCEGTGATGQVLVVDRSAEFGVISDIDDTIVYSSVTDRLKMIRIVLFHNAHTRIPFPGVAAFYRALKLGPSGRGANPIFYVSRSPWNLYDLFEAFFEAHDVPRGPLFLRDLHFLEARSRMLGKEQDKLSRIRKLFALYPDLPFVLIGDSGQQDPEIYRQTVLEHPGRVRAVYIRDVTSQKRDREVRALADEIRVHGVPLLLTKETVEAARHASDHGLISPRALPDVGHQRDEDEAEAQLGV